MRNPHSSSYRFVILSLPVVFVTGIAVTLIGAYIKNRWLMNIGVGVFFVGGAIWGFANGSFLIWLLFQAARKFGIRDLAAYPLKSAIFVLLTIFLIAAGVCFSWLALRGFTR